MNDAAALSSFGSIAVADDGGRGLAAPAESDRAPVSLHFAVLVRIEGVAILGCGWLSDPEGRVERITIGGDARCVDLLRDAVFLDNRAARAAMAIPEDAMPRLVFALAVAATPDTWVGGCKLDFHFADGRICPGFAAAAGAASDLAPIVASLPVEDGLRFAAGVVGAWRSASVPLAALPQPVERFLENIHKQIDPSRNYGAGASVWPAEGAIDIGLRVDRAGILLKGWFYHDAGDAIREAAAVSLLGSRIGIKAALPRVVRPDLPARDRAAGFILFAPAPGLEADDRFWFLEIVLESGAVSRLPFLCAPAPPAMAGIEAALQSIEPIEGNRLQLGELFRDAVSPAVDAFWARTRSDREPAAEIAYGPVAGAPQVSIVVPLYGRVDFVHHQIANFSNDPEFRAPSAVELVYVLDDPTQREPFERLCRDVHAIYGVPFRAVSLARNLGFSGANNAGAVAAAGSLLLFLNSDILPKRTRWAGRLLQTYRGLDRCGILGCRLLLEDGSIQHAGMTFGRSLLQPRCWRNEHPGKGLPVGFDPARGAVRVPAVTGACLAIDRALFAQLGGWPEEYVVGDFEDSDLCLKAWRAGWNVYYTPDVELYHLERQSVKLSGQASWRQTMMLYNEWKHTQIWGDFIPSVLERLGAG